MKYCVLSFLMAISAISIASAQPYPIVIPSGQQLYFEFHFNNNYPNNPNYTYAEVFKPDAINGWDNYAKPGGDVVIPDSIVYNGFIFPITRISREAFLNCDAITSIVVPNSVETIEYHAFQGCTSLHTLTIGTGVKRLANYGYSSWSDVGIISNCINLDTIYFNADSCYMGYMFDGEIGQHTAVVIGDNVRYIKGVLFRRPSLATVTRSIKSVVIGSSVSTIAGGAFMDCDDLASVTFRTQNPPMLGSNVFGGVNTDSVLCIIPCGRTSYYFNQWSSLFNYTEASSEYILNVVSNYDSWGTAEIIQQPSCDGNAVIGATASCGYFFVRWSDGNTENPRTLTLQNDTYLTADFASSYNVPDTVLVRDTTTINNYIHDTTYLPIYLHDTVPMTEYLHDTIYLPQYIHDTTIVNNYFRDTIYLPQYIHDTSFVSIHDTTFINVPIHDTTYITQIDTLTLMQHDTITNTIIDTLWLTQTDTLWLHDTIIIHDTIYVIQEGIDGVDALNAKVCSSQGQVVVEGADGKFVTLFDINGRMIATRREYGTAIRFDVPSSGTYMIKIGSHAAKKVVVIR